jgi:hypothetical protein
VTITTLRPDSTVLNVNVGTTGAASAFSVLDDSPDTDSTRAQGTANRAEVRLTLGTTAIGGTSRVMRARIRGRGAHEGTDVGHAENVNLRLYDPTTKVSGRNNSFSSYSTSFAAYSAGWETTPPGGTAWSQSIVDRLQARAFWTASVNGFFLFLSELYVDLDIYSQPAVSAVTVTGATATTRPDFSYAFAQTEGLPQDARQVKVFSAAQYGAAGFDPATSRSTWDSGVVLGPDATGTVGVDLTNGTTYKVYVAAGIGWPAEQGLGAFWYSTWVASSAFTIATIPPPAPTISVTQQTGLPGYRNLIRVSAPINLLTSNQASLETDTTGWAAVSNCSISRSTAYALDGTASLQLRSLAAGDMSAAISLRPRIEPGARIVIVGTGRAATAPRSVRFDLRSYNVAGAVVNTTPSSVTADATGADASWYATVVAPATMYSADILITVLATGGAAEDHRFDKLAIFYYPADPGSAAAAAALWTSGGYGPGATVVVYRAQRVSKNIARGPARNWIHPQLFSAGAITGGTDGFSTRQANDSVTQLPMDRPSPEGPAQVSAGMVEWAVRVAAVSYLDIGAPDGVATDGLHPYLMPAVPGKQMTASVWLWSDAAFTARLGVTFVDRYNTQVGSTVFSGNAVLTTVEQKVSVAATPPAGAVFARFGIENQAGVAGFLVRVAMPRWRPTADPDEFWPGQVFSWETETVRTLSSAAFRDGQNDVAIYDHEPPAGRPVLYWARVMATTAAGQSIASVDGTAVHVYQDPPATSLLKDPFQPENAFVADWLDDGHQLVQDEDAATFHPLGRDGDPVVWRDWLGGADGRISLLANGELQRYRLDQLHTSARPLLVHWAEGGNTYIRITGRAFAPQLLPSGLWRYDFTYLQVGRP